MSADRAPAHVCGRPFFSRGAGKHDAVIGRGVAWLEGHQDATGRWPASSINKHRDLDSDVGKFMSDAATSYAVMALEKVKAEWSTSR